MEAIIFNSHIDIISPGELLRPLKISEIMKDDYIPKSRNKVLVEVLSKSGVMDKRGTGFLRIRESMKKWNLPNPEFIEKLGYFVIKFVNPAIQKIPELDESKLNERQKKFFDRVIEGEEKITTQQYIELIGCSKRTAIRDLNQLVKLGVVVQKGSVTGRGRYYIIKVTKGDRKSKENTDLS